MFMRKMLSFMAVASMLLIFAGCSYSVAPPAGLKASSTPVTLTWGSVSWATGYNVYRGTASGSISTKTVIGQNVAGLTYADTAAVPGRVYYYQVTAVTADGSSGGSNEVTAHDGNILGGSIQGKTATYTQTVTTFAGFVNFTGATDATGTKATFDQPRGIATDGANLYVADTFNHIIRKVDLATSAVTTVAGQASTSGSQDGTGTGATFDFPTGITTDGTNLFVTDYDNGTIRKIVISTGAVTTLAGAPGHYGNLDGIGPAARLNGPFGITTDGTNLYVADFNAETIRKIVISTGAVTTIAGADGVIGSADGNGAAASFNSPAGITTDGTNLYVTDYDNGTIRKIVISTGAVTTIAGAPGIYGNLDGIGAAARLNGPFGITTDGTNLYVADFNAETIRQIVISSGAVTTMAGTNTIAGSADGTGSAALFSGPAGITTDGSHLYFLDSMNHTIRQLQ